MASISFASESLMDPRIQVKLDKYQKGGNIISQTSLLSSYTGSETDADIYICPDSLVDKASASGAGGRRFVTQCRRHWGSF